MLGAISILVACTLTSDEFEPELVDTPQLLPESLAELPPQSLPVGEAPCSGGACPANPPGGDPGVPCVGGDCPAGAPVALAASCASAGSRGTDACLDACRSDADCGSGFVCSLASLRCTLPSCADEVRSGSESDVDCGGACTPCTNGSLCNQAEDCDSRVCAAGSCAPPRCDDGVANADEADVDCGGSCATPCLAGAACRVDGDCDDGLFCPLDASVCRNSSCNDGVRNGDEVLADCGGGQCGGCVDGSPCGQAQDCESGVCRAGACAPPSCGDSVSNQAEAGVDCGGPCEARCLAGDACSEDADCQSRVCASAGCAEGVERCCQAPSCGDGVLNGDESDVDCGSQSCGGCAVGASCSLDPQCASGFCQDGRCQDPGSCSDGTRNGRESSVDCGGPNCQRCRDLSTCSQDSDCNNNNCDNRGICISCGDNVTNGTETGVDCGGADPFCRRCNPGERCLINSDCASGLCFGGFC